jgi:hypothetical protein
VHQEIVNPPLGRIRIPDYVACCQEIGDLGDHSRKVPLTARGPNRPTTGIAGAATSQHLTQLPAKSIGSPAYTPFRLWPVYEYNLF